MGFQLKLVVSSLVSRETRATIMSAAFKRWPYCRPPRYDLFYRNRVLFAPPELTDYLFATAAEEDTAIAQAEILEDQLTEWSASFAGVRFALIEADCFGGRCCYRGYCCRNGERVFTAGWSPASLTPLAWRVAYPVVFRHFMPFTRGFFAGKGSGGAK